jgi:GTP pyrophosphokinase
MYEAERRIDVEWERTTEEVFPVKVRVYTDDRPGVLNSITSILSKEDSNIQTLEARSDESRDGDGAIIDMTIEVRDRRQFQRVAAAARRVSGVRDVERLQ